MRPLLLSLAIAALAAGAIGAPAAAAGATRVVDNDGTGSATDCDASAPAFRTVQKAVNAADAGDTVLVCPGTYVGRVVIPKSKDRLVLQATRHLGATLKVRPGSGQASIIHIAPGADRVSVKDLALTYPAALPTAPAGGSPCGILMGIQVDGANAWIESNSVIATGRGTLTCGIAYGIGVGYSGKTASANLRFNVVRDIMSAGIAAGGPNVRLSAFRNIVRFYHDAAATVRTASARVGDAWTASVRRALVRQTPAGTGPISVADIAVFTGAEATIQENTAEAARTGRGPLATGQRLFAYAGIVTIGTGTVIVDGNRVYRAGTNIAVGYPVPIPAGETGGLTTVTGNVALSGFVGIEVGTTGATVSDNQAHGNAVGLYAQGGSSGNTFDGNDARANYGVDCEDDSSPIANTWTNNLAFTSQPNSLCLAP
jgi:parallel beta-helix repeat protein